MQYRKYLGIRRQSSTVWWTGIVLLTLLRLYVFGRDEIEPIAADSVNYAMLANQYLSGAAADQLPSQRPGIAILAIASAAVGIPYKLLIDMLLIATAYWGAATVRRFAGSSILGLLTYAPIVFSPWFAGHSRLFMSESVAALLLLAMPIGAAMFLLQPTSRWQVGGSIAIGMIGTFYLLTRPETPIFIFFAGALVVAAAVCHGRYLRKCQTSVRLRVLAAMIVPIAGALAAIQGWQQMHRVHFGVAAVSVTEMPGLKDLVNALYTVPPEEAIRYCPVTRQTMSLACDHSPTLNQFRERLLDLNRASYGHARLNLNLEGQVGTWLIWHLLECVPGSRPEVNQTMFQIADELRQAQREGKLGCRRAVFPFDPLFDQWLSDLPGKSFLALQASFMPDNEAMADDTRVRNRAVNAVDRGLFDDGLLRRRGTRSDAEIRISGECRPPSHFTRVQITTAGKHRQLGSARILSKANRSRFDFIMPRSEICEDESLEVAFLSKGALSTPLASHDIATNALTFLSPAGTGNGSTSVEAWSVVVDESQPGKNRLEWQAELRKWYWEFYVAFIVTSLLIGFATVGNRRRLIRLTWLALLCIALVACRSLFYALVEVSLGWGLRRYVEPNHLLATLTVILWAYVLGAFARRFVPRAPRLLGAK